MKTNVSAMLHILTWLNCELVNALLRMAWRTDRSEFCRLVDATDCYPCLVIYDECQLTVVAGRDAERVREQFEDEP